MSLLHFQLCDNSICMPVIVRDFFQKSLQFYQLSYVILNFIIHVRLKCSDLICTPTQSGTNSLGGLCPAYRGGRHVALGHHIQLTSIAPWTDSTNI